jgi:hypothetical protein
MSKLNRFITIIRKTTTADLRVLLTQARKHADDRNAALVAEAIESELSYRASKASD